MCHLVWFGLVWFGLVWFGLVWFGLVGLVWFRLLFLEKTGFGSYFARDLIDVPLMDPDPDPGDQKALKMKYYEILKSYDALAARQ